MNKIIGFFKKLTGEFFALDSSGNLREVFFGDAIFDNEFIVNDMGVAVSDALESIPNIENDNNTCSVCVVIGYLKELRGEFYAQNRNGEQRAVTAGDPIYAGEKVVNSDGEEVIDACSVSRGDIVDHCVAEVNIEADINESKVIPIISSTNFDAEFATINYIESRASNEVHRDIQDIKIEQSKIDISVSNHNAIIDSKENINIIYQNHIERRELVGNPKIEREILIEKIEEDEPIKDNVINKLPTPLFKIIDIDFVPTPIINNNISIINTPKVTFDEIDIIKDDGFFLNYITLNIPDKVSTNNTYINYVYTGGGGYTSIGHSNNNGGSGGGSTGGGSTNNISPTITPFVNSSRVSEEGIDGGLKDEFGIKDTTNSSVNIGQFIVSDGNLSDNLSISLSSPSGSFFANGEEINWVLSNNNQTLIGSTFRDIIKVHIDNSGEYKTELLGAIDHDKPLITDSHIENEIVIPIGVVVSDGNGGFDSSTLNIIIEDDSPIASDGDTILTLYVEPVKTNLSFIVDVSSSMSDKDLQDTKDAMVAVIDEYNKMGPVNVNVVQFYGNGNHQSGWIDVDEAKNLVLDNDQSGTDIEQGLRPMVENSYSGHQPDANQDIMYFFGDGNSYGDYQDDFDTYTGITRDGNGDITNINYNNDWTNFIRGGDINKLYTYSVNSDNMLSNIEHLADNGENNVSKPAINLNDIEKLKAELLATVDPFKDGSFASDDKGNTILAFGADSGHLDSVTIAGNTVNYLKDTPVQTIKGTHGDFKIDFNTGTYRYIVTDERSASHVETIQEVVVDNDGDKLEAINLHINIIYDEKFTDAPIIDQLDTSVVKNTTQVISTAIDANGSIDSFVLGATHGTLNLDVNGDISYTPYLDYLGDDVASISVTDNDGLNSTRNIAIKVLLAEDNADTPELLFAIDHGQRVANSNIDETNNFNTDTNGWSGAGVSLVNSSLEISEIGRSASNSFDFGVENADKKIDISFTTDIDIDNWEGGDDTMRVTLNDKRYIYTQSKESELDNWVTNTLKGVLDNDGKLDIDIFNDNNEIGQEWLRVDDFNISSDYSYIYKVDLSAKVLDTTESLSDVIISKVPDFAHLQDSKGDIIYINDDGTYTIVLSSDGSNSVNLISDGAMKPEDIASITASVTSTQSQSGDTSTVEATDNITAQVVDGIVEGLYYKTSSGISGYTDSTGDFDYAFGDTVVFSVGDVTVGSINMENREDSRVFLQDIADIERDESSEYVENMAVFLQSIDSSKDKDEIKIGEDTHNNFREESIDLENIEDDKLTQIIEDSGEDLISKDEAMEHVEDMLKLYDGIDQMNDKEIEDNDINFDYIEEDDEGKNNNSSDEIIDYIIDEDITLEDIIDIEDEDDIFIEDSYDGENTQEDSSFNHTEYSFDDTTVTVDVEDNTLLLLI